MTIFNISYKYRLYPNAAQTNQISVNFNCSRLIYNLMLRDKIEGFKNYREIPIVYPAMYFDKNPSLLNGDLNSFSFEQYHLEKAFRHYLFNKNCNFPKYKQSNYGRKSYTTGNRDKSIMLYKNKIMLPTLGIVKARIHRSPSQDAKIKSATISQDGDGKIFVSVQFQFEKTIKEFQIDPKTTIGLDYKSDGLYMSSNGKTPKNWRKFFREGEKKIAKEERKLRNKKKDSNNYKKQMMRIAKIHKHISNQRLDMLHKISRKIADKCSAVCVENLNMKEISRKNFHHGKSTMDNAYAIFLSLLEYKLKFRGKKLIKIDKYYPSTQICSNCGRKHKISLSERTYRCECGLEIDRDYNAAINIKREGLRQLKTK